MTPDIATPLPLEWDACYTTRFAGKAIENAPSEYALAQLSGYVPQAGDIIFATITSIGSHKHYETHASRKAIAYPGRVILIAYGNRYAADQFLGYIPEHLGVCHMLAAGGIAGLASAKHDEMLDPTAITPLGVLVRANAPTEPLNLKDFSPNPVPENEISGDNPPKVFAVVGTSMNSGKSTALAHLTNGLTSRGLKVACGKITGTGAGNDVLRFRDAGAIKAIDFTHYGHGTTFNASMDEVQELAQNMLDYLVSLEPDVVLVEIADGVLEQETHALLSTPEFTSRLDGVITAAADALGAIAAVRIIRETTGKPVPFATGVFTSSPVMVAEAGEQLKNITHVVKTQSLLELDPALLNR